MFYKIMLIPIGNNAYVSILGAKKYSYDSYTLQGDFFMQRSSLTIISTLSIISVLFFTPLQSMETTEEKKKEISVYNDTGQVLYYGWYQLKARSIPLSNGWVSHQLRNRFLL
jgi:hypothetical protein